MKRFLFFSLLLFGVSITGESQEMETLFSRGISISGFGGPFVEFSTMPEDELGVSVGGGGGMLLNQTFFLGGYGIGLASIHKRPDVYRDGFNPLANPLENPKNNNLSLNFGHGGLWLGYLHHSHKLVHWGISSKIGAGGISLIDREYEFDENTEVGLDVVYVLNPQVDMELNVASWFKLGAWVGYRYVGGISEKKYTNANGEQVNFYKKDEFNSPTAGISFLFGGFGKR